MRRFKVESVRGDEAYLRGQEARHALKVLRLRKGDEIVIFDGTGSEYLAKIEASSTVSVKLKVLKKLNINRDSPLDTVLYMGLTNRLPKFELAIQKSTELGVKVIVPIICKRSAFGEKIKDWSGKLKRWNEITVNAAKQCGRNILPEIKEPIKLDDIDDSSELKFVLWEKGGKSFKDYSQFNPTSVSVVIGPEGGLDSKEIETLKSKGFHVIHLGKRILRAETAAIASLSVVQFLWGDLG